MRHNVTTEKFGNEKNYMLLNTCFVKFYIILQKTIATVEVNDLKGF